MKYHKVTVSYEFESLHFKNSLIPLKIQKSLKQFPPGFESGPVT